jgi:hypothetical protein
MTYSLAVKCTKCTSSSTISTTGPHNLTRFIVEYRFGVWLKSPMRTETACSSSWTVRGAGEHPTQPRILRAFSLRCLVGSFPLMREKTLP